MHHTGNHAMMRALMQFCISSEIFLPTYICCNIKKNGVKILKQVQDDRLRFLSNTYILFTLNELHGIHCNYIFLVGGDNDGRNLRIGG